MSASRRLRVWYWRGRSRREGDERAPQRSSRNRRRPHFDGLEPRQLLSGNPPIREFPISTPTSQPLGITRGPDGNVWFTQSGPNGTPRIGRITTAGVVTGFASGLRAEQQPVGITAGPDGNLWFTEGGIGRIGRITTAGVVTEFSAGLSPGSSPDGITLGPDGNLWFAEQDGNRIGRITTAGVITEFSAGIRTNAGPSEIVAGADGNLWLTENSGHGIGRIDLALPGSGMTVNTTEGQPLVGTVATFTDSDGAAAPGNFTATIDWGDGTVSAGQVLEDAAGTFYVSGTHTYAEEGTMIPIVVTIADSHGDATTVNSTADVAQAPLLATGVPVSATEGVVVRAGTLLATFIDTGGADPLGDYLAFINWGDGSPVDAASIRASGGNFQVVSVAPHRYPAPGSFTVLVTIEDLDPANPSADIGMALASSTATVSDARLTEVAVDPLPRLPKGTPLSGVTVGSFFDANAFALAADFTATIDWGGGSPLTLGDIAQPNGPGTAFVVTGSHTYTVDRAQPYAITVTILDRSGRGLTTGTSAAVADAPPILGGVPVRMTKGLPFTAPLAFITEGPGLLPESPGHFTATIRWGDGTSSAGVIEAIPGGEWVVGSHTYARAGTFTITVTVRDDSGFTVATTTRAIDPPAPPGGSLHHRRHDPAPAHHKPGPPKPHHKAGSGHAAISGVPAQHSIALSPQHLAT